MKIDLWWNVKKSCADQYWSYQSLFSTVSATKRDQSLSNGETCDRFDSIDLKNPQIKNYFPKIYGTYLVTVSWIWSFCESVSFFGFKPSEPTHKISATWLRCEDEIFSMTVLFPQYFNKLVWDWNSKIRIKRTHFHDGIVKKVHLHSDYTYSLAIHNSIFKSC